VNSLNWCWLVLGSVRGSQFCNEASRNISGTAGQHLGSLLGAMGFFAFVFGILVGVGGSFALLVHLLSDKDVKNPNGPVFLNEKIDEFLKKLASKSSSAKRKNDHPSDKEEQNDDASNNSDSNNGDSAVSDAALLDAAMKELRVRNTEELESWAGVVLADSNSTEGDSPASQTPLAPGDSDAVAVPHLERVFNDRCRSSKERDRQLRHMAAFFTDLGKAIKSHHKELLKLSTTAASNVGRPDSDEVVDQWWLAVAKALEHLSLDQQSLSESISNDVAKNLSRVLESHTAVMKKFHTEGSNLVSMLRESQSVHESKLKERDKARERLTTVMEHGPGLSSSSLLSGIAAAAQGHNNNASIASGSKEGANEKYITRLELAEKALLESADRVLEAQKDFRTEMTKVVLDLQQTAKSALIDTEKILLRFAHSTDNAYGGTPVIVQRLTDEILYSDQKHLGGSSSPSIGFETALRTTLSELSQGTNNPAVSETDGGEGDRPVKLDLSLESSALLSAAPPTRIPKLPHSFQRCIESETCVWFNAFTGRIYRDIASSEYFQNWACNKMSTMLNKGNRPDYIDAFRVESVEFGTIPPLLSKVQWSPHATGCNNNSTQMKNVNVSDSAPSSPSRTELPKFMDSDYNVECTADLSLRTPIRITISTKYYSICC
jgi:hypothetical protein